MKQHTLHAIFFDLHDNWQNFYDKNRRKIRAIVKKEVLKFKESGDIRKGKLFVCEGCHPGKVVPLRCQGKFCPTCSVGESQRWSELVAEDMFHVIHRHMVFTIDEGLRTIFLRDHRKELLKGLMDEVAKVMMDYFRKKPIQSGIIVARHTFGSQLAFNPHVHMDITMGGMTPDGSWVDDISSVTNDL